MADDGLTAVRRRVAVAAERAGRDPASVTIVAVSKAHTLDSIRTAYDAGHRDFGENRAAELVAKSAELPADIRWHFVGTLQSRKASAVRPIVSLLHSLDREKLIRAWSRGDPPCPPALVQVDLAGEQQKHGADPGQVPQILDQASAAGVPCVGLMIIPPQPETPEGSRPWFRRLAELRVRLHQRYPTLEHLSMGMTDDFEVAVEEGATLIRVGRAIFGPRI